MNRILRLSSKISWSNCETRLRPLYQCGTVGLKGVNSKFEHWTSN